MNDKWNRRFMGLAWFISSWSDDPSTHVGAVAVDPILKKQLAMGWNGFPRKIADTPERYFNREIKYELIVHAETNVIYNATYTGTSLNGAYLYVWGLPVCNDCAKAIIQVGIKKVYITQESLDITTKDKSKRWFESWEKTKKLFEEAQIMWSAI